MQTVIERRNEIKRLIDGRSMFSRLFTYRGRENVNPEENFFTEGLAYILDKDRNLLQKFVEHIQNKFPDENLLKGFFGKNAEVRTQSFYRNLSGRHNFIDLEIEFEEALLWLEVKVESGPSGEDQIIRYEKLMGESDHIDHDRSGIVLLTKYEVIPNHEDEYYMGNVRWLEIYAKIDEHLDTEDATAHMCLVEENFLKLLEERNMSRFEPFNEAEKESSRLMEQVETKVERVLESIYEALKEKFGKEFQYSRQSVGKEYVGQKVYVKDIEFYYAVVTRGDRFGSLDMWFIPNQDQKKLIQSKKEGPVNIGFEEDGGSYIFRSRERDLNVIGNTSFLEDASKLIVDKIEEIINQF